jgi:mannosyltransferase
VLDSTKFLSVGSVSGSDASRVRVLAQLLLIVCTAVAVRAYAIGQQSLWSDELFSRYYADLFGLKFLWTTGFLHEDSPPLYYMAIAAWMGVFGTSEAAMRSFSLVASVAALLFVYLIGKELFGQRRAMLAAFIFALMPMQVSFAQEARTYALLLIPIGMSLLAIARFLGGEMRQRVLWLYGIGAIVALYCHATAAFFITACGLAVIIAILSDRRIDQRAALTRWIVTNALVALVAMPELFAMLQQGRTGAGVQWIPPFRPVDVVRALSPVIAGTATPDKFPGTELSFLLVAGITGSLFITRPPQRVLVTLVGIPVLFIALIATASLFQPIFISRVFCWLGIPLALLLANAVAARSILRPLLIAFAVITCITGLGYQFGAPQKEPWREVFNQIGPQLAQADAIVLAPMTDPTAFAYYAPYLGHLRLWDMGPKGNVENDQLPGRMGVQRMTRTQLVDAIRSGENVWLILRTPDLPYVSSLLETVPPPRVETVRSCGKALCIAALSWPRASPATVTGASAR